MDDSCQKPAVSSPARQFRFGLCHRCQLHEPVSCSVCKAFDQHRCPRCKYPYGFPVSHGTKQGRCGRTQAPTRMVFAFATLTRRTLQGSVGLCVVRRRAVWAYPGPPCSLGANHQSCNSCPGWQLAEGHCTHAKLPRDGVFVTWTRRDPWACCQTFASQSPVLSVGHESAKGENTGRTLSAKCSCGAQHESVLPTECFLLSDSRHSVRRILVSALHRLPEDQEVL